ncbi:MAG: MgtC/SapB family protein [Phocaeicola sp.]
MNEKVYELMFRLLLAGILGTLIGLEREYRAKEAGTRTHFLVSLGSALIMVVSLYGHEFLTLSDFVRWDGSRIAAQVVSGIGFIGAGTIIFRRQIVHGLTTAAGVWVAAGVGLAVGAGMYIVAAFASVLMVFGLEVMLRVFGRLGVKYLDVEFTTPSKGTLQELTKRFNREFSIQSLQVQEKDQEGVPLFYVTMVVKCRKVKNEEEIINRLQDFSDVSIYRIE